MIEPSSTGGIAFIRLDVIVKKSDVPVSVCPSTTHVTRARTGPMFAGMFAMSQLPSASGFPLWLAVGFLASVRIELFVDALDESLVFQPPHPELLNF